MLQRRQAGQDEQRAAHLGERAVYESQPSHTRQHSGLKLLQR